MAPCCFYYALVWTFQFVFIVILGLVFMGRHKCEVVACLSSQVKYDLYELLYCLLYLWRMNLIWFNCVQRTNTSSVGGNSSAGLDFCSRTQWRRKILAAWCGCPISCPRGVRLWIHFQKIAKTKLWSCYVDWLIDLFIGFGSQRLDYNVYIQTYIQ